MGGGCGDRNLLRLCASRQHCEPIAQAVDLIFMTGVSVRGVGLVDARMLATIALSLALTCVKIPKIEG